MQSTIETPTQPHSANVQPDDSTTFANKLERSDALLQLSRRVDWRFLLPSPALGRVAFVGPEGSAPFRALQRFCSLLARVDESFAGESEFELVVIHAGKAGNLDLAKRLLQPGGFLYWEIDRKKMFEAGQRMAAFRHFGYFVAALKKAGFDEIEVFWHRPNFKSCLEIIPLDDRPEASGLAVAFSKRGGNFKKQMKFWVGRFLWQSGMLSRVAPCVSIVSKKM